MFVIYMSKPILCDFLFSLFENTSGKIINIIYIVYIIVDV